MAALPVSIGASDGGCLLGLPLVFQTYRKTHAGSQRSNLEAAKLDAREAEDVEAHATVLASLP